MKLATLCYLRRRGQTLMLHRIKRRNDVHIGKWNGLGGKLEPGETPEECAIREIWEESGLRAHSPRLRGLLTFPNFDGVDDWYVYVYTVAHFEGKLRESTEGVLAWIADKALLQLPLWPGDRIFLPWLDGFPLFSAKFVYVDGQLVDHHVVFHAELAGPAPRPERPPHDPSQEPSGSHCWVCGGPILHRHCKLVCQVCGFTRDCSDP